MPTEVLFVGHAVHTLTRNLTEQSLRPQFSSISHRYLCQKVTWQQHWTHLVTETFFFYLLFTFPLLSSLRRMHNCSDKDGWYLETTGNTMHGLTCAQCYSESVSQLLI